MTMHETRVLARRCMAAAIAALGCGVSLVLTVRLCLQLRGASGDLLAGAMGLTWELAKWFFVACGSSMLASKRPGARLGGVAVWCVAAVLVVGSVVASLAYLLEMDGDARLGKAVAAAHAEERRALVQSMDQEMETLAAVAAADAQHAFRRRALEALADLRALREQRGELARQLAAAGAQQQAPPREASDLFEGLATIGSAAGLNLGASGLRLVAYGVLAVVLELIGITAIILFGGAGLSGAPAAHAGREASASAAAAVAPETTSRCTAEALAAPTLGHGCTEDGPEAPAPGHGCTGAASVAPAPGHGCTAGAPGANGRGAPVAPAAPSTAAPPALPPEGPGAAPVAAARDLIARGQMRPTYRDVQTQLEVGHRAARHILERLVDDGVLARQGRRYVERADVQHA